MKWTFGIVTNENKDGFLDKIIDSIEKQIIDPKKYETIIIGNYSINRKNTTVINFDESIKTGWITRKKNIIAQKANFENISIFHDYVSLCDNWYQGFLEFGANWDVCINPITNLDGTRFRDWVTWDPIRQVPYDNHNHIKKMYISGGYFCVKKNFILNNPLNENYIWGQGEDVEWSMRIRHFWNYKCNPNSTIKLLKQKDHDNGHKIPLD